MAGIYVSGYRTLLPPPPTPKQAWFSHGETYHEEAVASPKRFPVFRAIRFDHALAVKRHHHGRRLAHAAAADEGLNVLFRHRHHGNGLRRGQPKAVVIPRGQVAVLVQVAKQERHCAEFRQARAWLSQVLPMGALIALHVQQAVSLPQAHCIQRAVREICSLTVPHDVESEVCLTRGTRQTDTARWPIESLFTRKPCLTIKAVKSRLPYRWR